MANHLHNHDSNLAQLVKNAGDASYDVTDSSQNVVCALSLVLYAILARPVQEDQRGATLKP